MRQRERERERWRIHTLTLLSQAIYPSWGSLVAHDTTSLSRREVSLQRLSRNFATIFVQALGCVFELLNTSNCTNFTDVLSQIGEIRTPAS